VPLRDDTARRVAWVRLEQRLRPRQEPWWRRRALVLVVAAVLTVAAAGTAVALGDRIVDLVRGKPAPESFQGNRPGDPFGSFFHRLPPGLPKGHEDFFRQFVCWASGAGCSGSAPAPAR
jgi:hypothetical protein